MFVKILIGYLIFMSILTYFTYRSDKKRARKGKQRISEKTLLLMSLFGGCFGGYLAMIIKHHKTRHWYFVVTNIFSIVAYSLLIYYLW